jgi:pSer/pThr/pTyr-binding forkhead associated (FHA) protein
MLRSLRPLDSGPQGSEPMPAHGSQHTTVTTPGSLSGQSPQPGLSLSWLFPRPSDPAIALELSPGQEWVLGRDESCSVRLEDPDVSRRHLRLHREGTDTLLTDLGSRNGTRVNGHPTKTARLALGDVVRLGGCVAWVTAHPGPVLEIAPGLVAGPLLRAELEGVMRAAESDLPVILEGETGTGKEVVARAIHTWSQRRGPFAAVNCAALTETLAEGELFGYRRGAFTGAERASPGLFRSAQGGTLLLDEVADLPLGIQAKLLRVIEQREVQPLGETTPVAIDARILVATQEPLRDVVARRQFRPDLLARLDGISVRLPPLRERPGDVPALFARVFAAESAGRAPALEADFVERLCLHDWPFNVREVVLLAKRLRVLRGDQVSLRASDLPPGMGAAAPSLAAPVSHDPPETDLLPLLISALRTSRGNVAQAAAVLGISRQRAYRLMQEQSVDLEALRQGPGAHEPP